MDRLPALAKVVGAVALVAACDGGGGAKPGGPAPSRVNAVKSAPARERTAADLCDVRHSADQAPKLAIPTLAPGSA